MLQSLNLLSSKTAFNWILRFYFDTSLNSYLRKNEVGLSKLSWLSSSSSSLTATSGLPPDKIIWFRLDMPRFSLYWQCLHVLPHSLLSMFQLAGPVQNMPELGLGVFILTFSAASLHVLDLHSSTIIVLFLTGSACVSIPSSSVMSTILTSSVYVYGCFSSFSLLSPLIFCTSYREHLKRENGNTFPV